MEFFQEFGRAILIAVVSALVTAVFYGRKITADLRKEFQGRVNAEKWKAYTEFIDWIGRVTFLVKEGDVSLNQVIGDMMHHIDLVLLLGSSDVVNAVRAYWDGFVESTSKDPTDRLHQDRVWPMLNAMRKDLGYDSVNFAAWQDFFDVKGGDGIAQRTDGGGLCDHDLHTRTSRSLASDVFVPILQALTVGDAVVVGGAISGFALIRRQRRLDRLTKPTRNDHQFG